jgi:hypothetical protein
MIMPISRGLRAFIVAGTVLSSAGPALADTRDFIDLRAAVGFSSNPRLRLNSSSSAFGRLSAYAEHGWHSERGKTTLSAYVENTTYLKDYGSKQIFDLDARTQQAVSPNVSVFGDLRFTGDFAGQLSNRLYSVPSEPPVTDPGNPIPPDTNNPDLFGLVGRQYRIEGQVGASIRTSAKGTLSVSAGAEHLMFSGRNSPSSYNVYFGSVGYNHQVTERTGVGATLFLQRQDFAGSDYANVINPTLTAHTQLSETMTASGAVGILTIQQHRNGETHTSTSPSFSASLCNATSVGSFCGRIARDAQTALGRALANTTGEAAVRTSASLDYYRRLGRNDTFQASISGTRYSTAEAIPGDGRFRTTYLSTVVGYDRKLGPRMSAGVSGGARKLFQTGPDPRIDLNASAYLRYRIGDLL